MGWWKTTKTAVATTGAIASTLVGGVTADPSKPATAHNQAKQVAESRVKTNGERASREIRSSGGQTTGQDK